MLTLAPNRLILGIDPGLTGAMCFLSRNTGNIIDLFDMPTTIHTIYSTKNTPSVKKHLDIHSIVDILKKFHRDVDITLIEKVHSFPGQGVASTFKFGKGYGILLGVLATLNLKVNHAEPAVWKLVLGLSSDKNTSLQLAREKFPNHGDFFKLKKHDGRAEAALLAWLAWDRLSKIDV